MADYKLLEPVSVDVAKRLAENSFIFPFELLDECDEYRFYRDSGKLLREDKKTGVVVHFGYGSNARVYKGLFYCYQWGSICGDRKIYRCKLDGSDIEYLDILSNKKVFDKSGHNTSEDNVSNMIVEGDSLVIYVSRNNFKETKYKIIITDNDGILDIKKEIISEKNQSQNPQNAGKHQRVIIPIESLPTFTIPTHKLLHNQKIQKYINNLFVSINNKTDAMLRLLSEKNLLSTKVATNISMYSFGYSLGGLEYSFQHSNDTDKDKILNGLYSMFKKHLDSKLLSPNINGNQRKELIEDIWEENAKWHEFTNFILTAGTFEEDWLDGITHAYLSAIEVYTPEIRSEIPINYQVAMMKMLSFTASDIV